MTRERRNKPVDKPVEQEIIALRDFTITHNEHHFVIKKGDDIIKVGVPRIFYNNLVTEKIITGV